MSKLFFSSLELVNEKICFLVIGSILDEEIETLKTSLFDPYFKSSFV